LLGALTGLALAIVLWGYTASYWNILVYHCSLQSDVGCELGCIDYDLGSCGNNTAL